MIFLMTAPTQGHASADIAFNVITYWPLGFRTDDSPQGLRVKRLLAKMHSLGANMVIFNFRGKMITGRSSDIYSYVPEDLQEQEEALLKQTIRYAKDLGMKIAFRPILLVVGPQDEFPFVENGYTWWHGNIRPDNPSEWFDHFFNYHKRYMKIAREVGASWYSIGAEMHSLTSGLGSRDPSWRFGFPELWVDFVAKARNVLGPDVEITYGANYTDQYVLEEGQKTWGGEFAQWYHDLTFLTRTPEEIFHQEQMRTFWRSLDFVGLDYYRALGSATTDYPSGYSELVGVLSKNPMSYAQNLNDMLSNLDETLGIRSRLAVQEVGYRSVEKCFVAPYLYEDDHTPINYEHQAAAWEALLQAMWEPQWPWMQGIGIWQVLVDDDSDMSVNGGFSPLGKSPAENVLKNFFTPKTAPQ
ncbi:hypothetical protein NWE73_14010 [Bdellovibrio sp. PAP01]|uniref:Uncharacterized protein n=2 Tax=Bdellovibrio svalbardensis TaxID=2972972 RepID=A0ABT6DKU9_9BACT|nr:hypothetical protein [Bdellovibrio svalbardensis]